MSTTTTATTSPAEFTFAPLPTDALPAAARGRKALPLPEAVSATLQAVRKGATLPASGALLYTASSAKDAAAMEARIRAASADLKGRVAFARRASAAGSVYLVIMPKA